jgi:hypothetical protein
MTVAPALGACCGRVGNFLVGDNVLHFT